MDGMDPRWILSFDASCGRCRDISSAVARACDGKLEVLPLKHPDVCRWREESLGSRAPWAPTLLRVQRDSARAWTGKAIAIPLVRHLGPRSTIRVLRSLGDLRSRQSVLSAGQMKGETIARAHFLKLVAGAGLAAGIILSGRAPAFADPGDSMVRRWVEENMDRLPRLYDDVVAYPVEYRKAIYSAHTPAVKSQLWVEHLKRYRATHPGLSEEQDHLIGRALKIASNEAMFDSRRGMSNDVRQQVDELGESTRKAFGLDESYALIGTLGPSERPSLQPPGTTGCKCTITSDFCTPGAYCYSGGCVESEFCGMLYVERCNGLCKEKPA